jgi:hypothetical protein
MKRAVKKNEIPGKLDKNTPTVLNFTDSMLVEMNNRLGVTSGRDNDDHSIISVIKNHPR